eukprot:Clim_evm29s241 gene=Clim_evmTU29s241
MSPVQEQRVPEAWYMCEDLEDQRFEHKLQPNVPADIEALHAVGVYYEFIPANGEDREEMIEKLRKNREYANMDEITVSKERLPNYEEKIKSFYEEHLHEDEEIRYVLEGSGYFDVRDKDDKWIRIKVTPGDLLVLPAGIYHRFTLDTENYIKARRLFKEEPKWIALNRPQAKNPHRVEYAKTHGLTA